MDLEEFADLASIRRLVTVLAAEHIRKGVLSRHEGVLKLTAQLKALPPELPGQEIDTSGDQVITAIDDRIDGLMTEVRNQLDQ